LGSFDHRRNSIRTRLSAKVLPGMITKLFCLQLVTTALLLVLRVVTASAKIAKITVRSAGWDDGNLAEFFLDDAPAALSTGRGVNLLVLRSNGTIKIARTFDTHGNASASLELANLLSGLERGALVALAVQDDASASLTEEARTALEQCCFAQQASDISSRSSYLLVAVNRISALAERCSAGGEGAVEATVLYNGIGPLDGFSLQVRSSKGNGIDTAEFYANGEVMDCGTGAGINVATLGTSGDLAACQFFETHRNITASEVVAAYLDALADGTPVLVAASGEASEDLTASATAALARCGATFASTLGPHASYALAGSKGGQAIAETLVPTGSGGAEVVLVGALVKSAGWEDGNIAEFYTNGKKMQVPTGRGLNVVVLNQDGSKNASYTFDTHAAGGAEELAQMVEGLVEGTPVLVATRDEASDQLREAGLLALEALGARSVRGLADRDSFALIGVRGAASPLAELAVPHGNGPAVVGASWSTNASLPMPHCGVFECPDDAILREDAWDIEGHTSSACCQERVPNMMSIAVESAGWDDGNFARFFADGKPLSIATGRGLVIVVLRVDGSVQTSSVFDTDAAGSKALASFVASIEDGRPVLVAAADEAAANLSTVAREALKSCGAKYIDQLSWRGSYALVGVKWSAALAERVTMHGSGPAQIVAHYEKVVTTEAPKPACNGRLAEPPVKGYLSNGQLDLEANCRYELWQGSQASACLEGAWVVVPGGSNTILMTINLANLLVPGALSPIDDHASMGSATVIDLVIEDGNVTYKNSVKLAICTPEPFGQACRKAILAEVAKVPPYSPRATRITQFVAQYWDHVDAALDAVEADTAWTEGQVALITQVSAWYIYCSVKGVEWCPRKELLSKMDEAGLDNFVSDMMQVVPRLENFCGPDGRAGVRGCVVGTTSWQNPPPGRQTMWYGRYNDAIKEAIRPIASPTLRLIDFWELGMAMPTECIGGHGSPVANLWSWQVMLAGFCPKGEASDGSFAAFEGAMCYAAEAEMSKCPYYKEECPHTFRCERWECASSVPCTMSATEPPRAQEAAHLGVSAIVQNIDFGLLSANASLRIAFSSTVRRIVAEQAGHGTGLQDVLITLEEGSVRIRAKVKAPDDDSLIAMNAELRSSSAGLTSALLDGVTGLEGILQAMTGTVNVVDVDVSIQGDLEACDATIVSDFLGAAIVHGDSPCGRLWCWEVEISEYLMAAVGAGAVAFLFIGQKLWSRLEPLLPPRLRRARPKAAAPKPKALETLAAATAPVVEEPLQASTVLSNMAPAVGVVMSQGGGPDQGTASQAHSLPPKSPNHTEVAITIAATQDPGEASAATSTSVAVKAAPATEAKEAAVEQLTAKTKNNTAAGKHSSAKGVVAGDKFPLGMARFMASLHVVLGHIYAKGVTPSIYFFGWGFTWVPWFFMLSGFILFSAEARRPRSESVLSYVSRRLVSIYPLYAVSLLAAFVIAKTQGVAPSFPVLLLQVWLAQAWVPLITERTLQMQCWFISCLVVYWVAFRPLFGCVSRLKSLSGVVSCMIVLYLLPWLAVSLPAIAGDAEWYEEHTFGRLDSPLDFVVVFLKFHPLCYVHVFILGLLLARFRELLEPFAKHVAVANVMQVLAPLGYLGLLLVFCLPALRPPGAKLSARLSVLLPLQSAVLLGLAGLPGAELPFVAAKAAQLNFLEGYSYAVYVMQFICYHLWPAAQAGPIFFAFLAAVAVVAVHAVQRPAEALWQRHRACAWLTPVALTGLLGVLSALPEPTRNTDLPAFRELEDLVVDVRLSLLAEGEDSGGRQGAALINPSMLFRDNGAEAVFAARRHRRTSERSPGFYDGRSVTVVEEIWHSEVVLGTLVLDDVAWSSWLRGGTPVEVRDLHRWSGLRTVTSSRWVHLCVRERWIPENNTLVRLVVTGPEDAKVFQRFPDVIGAPGISVAFNSYPPLGRYGCGQDQAVSQMYLAEGVDPRYPRNKSYGIRLDCGHQDRAEKNWIPFQHEGRLHFVYSVLPHVVAEARSDGRCGNRFYSSFAPLVKLQAEHPGLALRGSAQAVRVDDPDATPRLPKAHYLALLHIVDPKTHRYAHFAYRFKAEAPFDILQVSSQLPLMAAEPDEGGPSFAFASGLALRGQQIVVTYAAGDRDPRALVMPLQRLDAMFATDVAPGQAAGSLAAAASFGGELRPASF